MNLFPRHCLGNIDPAETVPQIIWWLESAALRSEVEIAVALEKTSMSFCLLHNLEKLLSNMPRRQIKINLPQPAENTDRAKLFPTMHVFLSSMLA